MLRPLCSIILHENDFFNRCVSVGIFYHIQWVGLMLVPFRVSNPFYLTLICQLVNVVLTLIIFKEPNRR